MSILPLAGSLTSSHRAFSPHTWLGKCTPAFIDDTAIFLRYNWYARIFIIYTASWQILFSLHGIKKKCVFYGRGSYLTLVRDKNVRRLWTMLSRRGCEGRSEGVGWQSFEGPSHCFYIASSRLCLKVCQRTVSIWRGGCDAQQPPSLFSILRIPISLACRWYGRVCAFASARRTFSAHWSLKREPNLQFGRDFSATARERSEYKDCTNEKCTCPDEAGFIRGNKLR